MIAPLAKLLDWLAIQLVWGMRVKSLLKQHGHPPNPKLEEALELLKSPDFIPLESPPAQLEFTGARNFRFPAPRPGEFAENNVVYGRLYRCTESWQNRPVIILLHGAGGDPDYHFEFPLIARQCNRAGFNAAMLIAPFQFQRRPRQLAKLSWPNYLLMAEMEYAQAVAEIRAFTGWLLAEGCPAVALWGNSYGGALAGLMACHDARLSAAVLVAPGLDMNVFLSAAKQIVWPGLREELLRQQPACEALNRTALNLTNTRPCILRENILLIEAIHDLFVNRNSMEALWQAWGATRHLAVAAWSRQQKPVAGLDGSCPSLAGAAAGQARHSASRVDTAVRVICFTIGRIQFLRAFGTIRSYLRVTLWRRSSPLPRCGRNLNWPRAFVNCPTT